MLAAWAEATSRARIGLMVGANTFRNPALVAKMAPRSTTSAAAGRCSGSAGHGSSASTPPSASSSARSPGERLRWLEEAVRIMRGMLHGEQPSGDRYYTTREVRNDPLPLQEQPAHRDRRRRGAEDAADRGPLRRRLQRGRGLRNVKHKDEVLRRHCEEVGRDESEIERTAGVGVCIIRDDPAEAKRVVRGTFRHNGDARPWENQLVGTPEQIADKLRPYLGIGFRHFSVGCPPPYDAESMERLVTEVKPMLEAG